MFLKIAAEIQNIRHDQAFHREMRNTIINKIGEVVQEMNECTDSERMMFLSRKKEFYEKEIDRLVHKIRRLDVKLGILTSYIN